MALALDFSSDDKVYVLPKGGARPARLMSIIDVGVQRQEPYKGKVKKPSAGVILGFDLVDDLDDEGKPVRISTGNFPLNITLDYQTRSLHPKSKLAAIVKSLDPSGKLFKGDLTNLLSCPCIVNVKLVEKNKDDGSTVTYANFSGAGPVPDIDGFVIKPSANDPFVFDFDNPSLEAWEQITDRLKVKIREAINYPKSDLAAVDEVFLMSQAEDSDTVGDDVPF